MESQTIARRDIKLWLRVWSMKGERQGGGGGTKKEGKERRDATRLVVLLPALGQQSVLHDPDGREELQRSRKKDGEGVEELRKPTRRERSTKKNRTPVRRRQELERT